MAELGTRWQSTGMDPYSQRKDEYGAMDAVLELITGAASLFKFSKEQKDKLQEVDDLMKTAVKSRDPEDYKKYLEASLSEEYTDILMPDLLGAGVMKRVGPTVAKNIEKALLEAGDVVSDALKVKGQKAAKITGDVADTELSRGTRAYADIGSDTIVGDIDNWLKKQTSANTARAKSGSMTDFLRFMEGYTGLERPGVDVLKGMTPKDIQAYGNALRSQGVSGKTVNMHLSRIDDFMGHLKKEGRIDPKHPGINKLDFKRGRSPEREKVTQPVFQEMLIAAGELKKGWKGSRDKAVLTLMYNTGLRRSEILNLNIDDIIRAKKTGELIAKDAKGKKTILKDFSSTSEEAVDNYLKMAPHRGKVGDVDVPLFLNSEKTTRMRTSEVDNMVIDIVSVTDNVPTTIRSHNFRHAYGTGFSEEGGLSAAQKAMGHASPTTTAGYAGSGLPVAEQRRIAQKFQPITEADLKVDKFDPAQYVLPNKEKVAAKIKANISNKEYRAERIKERGTEQERLTKAVRPEDVPIETQPWQEQAVQEFYKTHVGSAADYRVMQEVAEDVATPRLAGPEGAKSNRVNAAMFVDFWKEAELALKFLATKSGDVRAMNEIIGPLRNNPDSFLGKIVDFNLPEQQLRTELHKQFKDYLKLMPEELLTTKQYGIDSRELWDITKKWEGEGRLARSTDNRHIINRTDNFDTPIVGGTPEKSLLEHAEKQVSAPARVEKPGFGIDDLEGPPAPKSLQEQGATIDDAVTRYEAELASDTIGEGSKKALTKHVKGLKAGKKRIDSAIAVEESKAMQEAVAPKAPEVIDVAPQPTQKVAMPEPKPATAPEPMAAPAQSLEEKLQEKIKGKRGTNFLRSRRKEP